LLGGTIYADTAHHELCVAAAMRPAPTASVPHVDRQRSVARRRNRAAKNAFIRYAQALGTTPQDIDKTICHQVGTAHKKLIFQTLGLDPAADFSTFEFLGNTGSAALPITAALAAERGHLQAGNRTALFGIGSGVNVISWGSIGRQCRSAAIPSRLRRPKRR